jgi:hypothetical protein
VHTDRLALLRNRMAARLEDGSLTTLQLLDIATAVTLLRGFLDRALMAHQAAGFDPHTVQTADTSLQWIKFHANDASVAELRHHIDVALRTAAASLAVLDLDGPSVHANDVEISGQESAYGGGV